MIAKQLDINHTEYHNLKEYISASDCKVLLNAPFDYKVGEKKEATEAMELGTFLHMMILEPHLIAAHYARLPLDFDGRKKEYKDLKASIEAEGKIAIKDDVWADAEAARESLFATSAATILQQQGGVFEKAYVGEIDGIKCRCKPDFYLPEQGVIVDLKTTRKGGAYLKQFNKTLSSLQYHMQAAFYLDLLQARQFYFIVLEVEAPFMVGVYKLAPQVVDVGRALIKEAFYNLKNLDSFTQLINGEKGEREFIQEIQQVW